MSTPDVEQIEEVLRTDVAEPSPAFAAEVDRRVAERFPKPARRRPQWLRPALAGAAALIVVAVVAISVIGNDGRHKSSRSGQAAAQLPRELSHAARSDAALS